MGRSDYFVVWYVCAMVTAMAVLFGLASGAMNAGTARWEDVRLFDTPIKKLLPVFGLSYAIAFWLFGGFAKQPPKLRKP